MIKLIYQKLAAPLTQVITPAKPSLLAKLPRALLLCGAGLFCAPAFADLDVLDVRLDAREPSFAQVMFDYYQEKPYEALTKLLSSEQLSFNASGTVNVMLGDLYARYGLTREADAAISRAINSDVTASNRNKTWLRFGKLLYQTGQDSLGLNFLTKVPNLLTPMQESERVLMLANVLIRQDRVDEAIKLLETYQTPSPFYQILSQYNLALAELLEPKDNSATPPTRGNKDKSLPKGQIKGLSKNQRAELALSIMEKLNVNGLDPKQNAKLNKTNDGHLEIIEDDTITDSERLNLKDKISLSMAYLYLQLKAPEKARQALRSVRLDSPYSNQALLTSAHVYWQLKDFNRVLTFGGELSKRSPSDPLVQEGWILTARAMEELKDPNAATQYRTIIGLYKAQIVELSNIRKQIAQNDILRFFPVTDNDPILLSLPDIRTVKNAGIWAHLLDKADVLAVIQQARQTSLLQSKLMGYKRRLTLLNTQTGLSEDQRRDLKNATALLERVGRDFDDSRSKDQGVLAELTKEPLDDRQAKVDVYLTESLLGLQRVEQAGTAN